MQKIMKGYVFRLYPSVKQIELIEKSFGCSRYIYNYFLGKNKNYINSYNSIKEIPNLIKENTWLSEVDSCLLRTSIFNLEDSFKRYKNGLSEYPKFKSKNKTIPSYRTNNITSTYKGKTYNSISIDLEKRIIKLNVINLRNAKAFFLLQMWYNKEKNRKVKYEAKSKWDRLHQRPTRFQTKL